MGFGAQPTYEPPSRRWALAEPGKFNDVAYPVWRWVSAGLGALLLAGALVARRMLRRTQLPSRSGRPRAAVRRAHERPAAGLTVPRQACTSGRAHRGGA